MQANKQFVSEGNAGIMMTSYHFETGAIALSLQMSCVFLLSSREKSHLILVPTTTSIGREGEGMEGNIFQHSIDLHQGSLT